MNTIFNYKGSDITFSKNGEVMVNATEMAKPFMKLPADFVKTQRTQDFIKELSAMKKIIPTDLVKVVNGGSNFGTWFHEDVALEFARWLSPAFAIWCNDRIKELVKHGATAINPDDLLNPDFIISLATQLKTERAEKQALLALTEEQEEYMAIQHKTIEEQAPKVLFATAVETSTRSVLVSELAKIISQNGYEIGQNRLFQWLRDHDYLCTKGDYYNQPSQRAVEMGLFEMKKTTITKPDGSVLVSTTTKVTGKGQIYFVDKFLKQVSVPA